MSWWPKTQNSKGPSTLDTGASSTTVHEKHDRKLRQSLIRVLTEELQQAHSLQVVRLVNLIFSPRITWEMSYYMGMPCNQPINHLWSDYWTQSINRTWNWFQFQEHIITWDTAEILIKPREECTPETAFHIKDTSLAMDEASDCIIKQIINGKYEPHQSWHCSARMQTSQYKEEQDSLHQLATLQSMEDLFNETLA